MRIQRTAPLILAAALLLPACSGDSGPTVIEIPLAAVEITSGCSSMAEGTTCQMAARGITAEGQIVTNAVLRWSSSASSVAQVDSDGQVFAIAPGQATITVEAAFGEGSDSSEVFVLQVFPK